MNTLKLLLLIFTTSTSITAQTDLIKLIPISISEEEVQLSSKQFAKQTNTKGLYQPFQQSKLSVLDGYTNSEIDINEKPIGFQVGVGSRVLYPISLSLGVKHNYRFITSIVVGGYFGLYGAYGNEIAVDNIIFKKKRKNRLTWSNWYWHQNISHTFSVFPNAANSSSGFTAVRDCYGIYKDVRVIIRHWPNYTIYR
jgi:hypothetical protein